MMGRLDWCTVDIFTNTEASVFGYFKYITNPTLNSVGFQRVEKGQIKKGPLWEGAGTAQAVTGGESPKVLYIYDIW